ncbi:hypothetical protein QBC32DRAFT_212530 [Pseudoneurospora amorphoporcata]|uniref:Uncharacterized protein n=1 Tax=Pseudoneurospora amorphoporcata TaxID=241081 RepID=A0AAN6NV44_9PEZI|nr:hypothetical protein QBC32DRAFT_212530 [Pseudoneurospora amorphoporcata]
MGEKNGFNDTTTATTSFGQNVEGLEGGKIPVTEDALVCMFVSLVGLWVIHSAEIGVPDGFFFCCPTGKW